MSPNSSRRTLVQVTLAGVVALAMVLAFVAVGSMGPVFAKGGNPGGGASKSGQIRPGCGFGDPNHTHTGAPGNPGACSRTSSESETHTRHSRTQTESESESHSRSVTRTMTDSTSTRTHHKTCTTSTHKKKCKSKKH